LGKDKLASAVPFLGSAKHPAQYAGRFGHQCLFDAEVRFGRPMDEWHDNEPAPNGVIEVGNLWLMVAEEGQFEFRHKVEAILPHETRRNLIPAGQKLDAVLPDLVTGPGLTGDDHARAIEPSQLLRMLLK